MKHPGRWLTCGALALVVLVGIGVVAMFGGLMGATQQDGTGECASTGQAEPLPTFRGRVGGLDQVQLEHAGTVIVEGRRLGVPTQGIVVALAVASQESRFRNYANDGRGSDITLLQAGVSQSLDLPHDAVGSDHGSVGIFQQQWPWWGSLPDLMDPARSADKFYAALLKVRGWQRMPVTVAAQRVQRSAFPDAYADDEAFARRLLGQESGSAGVEAASYSTDTATDCTGTGAAAAAGPVVFPLPRSASYVDQHNYGRHGARWAHMHTGTDLSAACGTPVLAATAGRIIVRTDQRWAGRWLVQVSTGTGRLTTWYGHMRALTVTDGEQVSAGQQIGEVGDLGNATGCHLHFEVHPRGGTIYQDSTDPTAWLRLQVGGHVTAAAPQVQPVGASSGSDWFTVATLNVLGNSHTAPGGNEGWRPSGATRMRGVVDLLTKYGVDLVGFQELQGPQHRSFEARVGGAYAVWSPPGDTENSIAWRRDRFRLVRARSLSVPYFDGHHRRMPVVLLQDRMTGRQVWLGNFHNPAETGRYHHQNRFRNAAKHLEMGLAARLGRAGRPVLITGDMNERASYFCSMASSGLMHAAAGGRAHPCRAPTANGFGIDWIFGSRAVDFSDFRVDHGRLARWTTDHPLAVTRAHAG